MMAKMADNPPPEKCNPHIYEGMSGTCIECGQHPQRMVQILEAQIADIKEILKRGHGKSFTATVTLMEINANMRQAEYERIEWVRAAVMFKPKPRQEHSWLIRLSLWKPFK